MVDAKEGIMKRPLEEDDDYSVKRSKGNGPRIELKVLLQSKNAGAIIGKGGNNIKRLRNEYKGSITVPDCAGPERVLTIGADVDTALDCLLDIIQSLEDYKQYEDRDFDCEIRFLVHQSQAGCIIGRAGFKIKELREKTGAHIKVYSTCCPQSTDRVVAITGKPEVVTDCINHIFKLLESAPIKGVVHPYDPHNYDEFYAYDYGGYTVAEGGRGKMSRGAPPPLSRGGGSSMNPQMRGRRDAGMGGTGQMNMGGMRGDYPGGRGGGPMGRGGMRGSNDGMVGGAPRGRDGQVGYGDNFNNSMGGMGPQGMMFGGMEQQTTQLTIPKDLAGAIIGKGGNRITEVRCESGAQIVIDDPLPGSNERIISITGSQDQIELAQYLLQNSVKRFTNRF